MLYEEDIICEENIDISFCEEMEYIENKCDFLLYPEVMPCLETYDEGFFNNFLIELFKIMCCIAYIFCLGIEYASDFVDWGLKKLKL